jgi:hypothetical protein
MFARVRSVRIACPEGAAAAPRQGAARAALAPRASAPGGAGGDRRPARRIAHPRPRRTKRGAALARAAAERGGIARAARRIAGAAPGVAAPWRCRDLSAECARWPLPGTGPRASRNGPARGCVRGVGAKASPRICPRSARHAAAGDLSAIGARKCPSAFVRNLRAAAAPPASRGTQAGAGGAGGRAEGAAAADAAAGTAHGLGLVRCRAGVPSRQMRAGVRSAHSGRGHSRPGPAAIRPAIRPARFRPPPRLAPPAPQRHCPRRLNGRPTS